MVPVNAICDLPLQARVQRRLKQNPWTRFLSDDMTNVWQGYAITSWRETYDRLLCCLSLASHDTLPGARDIVFP